MGWSLQNQSETFKNGAFELIQSFASVEKTLYLNQFILCPSPCTMEDLLRLLQNLVKLLVLELKLSNIFINCAAPFA